MLILETIIVIEFRSQYTCKLTNLNPIGQWEHKVTQCFTDVLTVLLTVAWPSMALSDLSCDVNSRES